MIETLYDSQLLSSAPSRASFMETTFRALALRGSMIQAVRFESSDLSQAIEAVNERFGTHLSAPESLYDEVIFDLRRAAGRFSHETEAIEKAGLLSRLQAMKNAAQTIEKGLELAIGGSCGDGYEVTTFVMIRDLMAPLHPDSDAGVALAQTHRAAANLRVCCEEAESILASMADKKGRRALTWYDAFAKAVLRVAERLGIALHTAGNRADDAHATPFTVLARELERALPEAARSESLAACNKRLQRSLGRLRAKTK